MDAVRPWRRDRQGPGRIKVEGAYHGSADGSAFKHIDLAEAGPRDCPAGREHGDLRACDGRAPAHRPVQRPGGDRRPWPTRAIIAGTILEPIMMNCGATSRPTTATSPSLRELLHRHGALLTFDEVKTRSRRAGRRRRVERRHA